MAAKVRKITSLFCLAFLCLASGCIRNPDSYDQNDYNNPSGYYSAGERSQYNNYNRPAPRQYNQQHYQNQGYYQQQNNGYYPYPQGGSRSYENPYDLPPSSNYQYYDSDQYYVPQRSYQNVEPSNAASYKY